MNNICFKLKCLQTLFKISDKIKIVYFQKILKEAK